MAGEGKGSGDHNIKQTRADGVDERARAEHEAVSALQKDFHMSGRDAMRTVQQFEQNERGLGKVDEKTIAQDLTRIVGKLNKLFEPGPNGEASLFEQCKADGHGSAMKECMDQTAQLAKQLAASFETGKIKPGQDTQTAVRDLMEKLNTKGA